MHLRTVSRGTGSGKKATDWPQAQGAVQCSSHHHIGTKTWDPEPIENWSAPMRTPGDTLQI